MSYKISTSLSTVLAMLNILKQTNLDIDQKAQVEITKYSSKHLLQLADMVTNNVDIYKDDVKLNLLALNLDADLSQLFKVLE